MILQQIMNALFRQLNLRQTNNKVTTNSNDSDEAIPKMNIHYKNGIIHLHYIIPAESYYVLFMAHAPET